ncbi:MAG: retroviral-like aspartic protease family protein [Bacteroidota bacterium]
MNQLSLFFYAVLTFALFSCSGSKIISLASQGETSVSAFDHEVPVYYLGNHLFVDVLINGKTYPFLFDTGWEITHIDQSLREEVNFTPLKKYKTSGSSFETQKLQYGAISGITIGGLTFQDLGVGIQDLSFVTSSFPDKRKIYGIIGTNVMRKAHWQIDYAKQTLRFSNDLANFPPPSNAHRIELIPRNSANWGLTRIELSINGVRERFAFDTGSYGSFSANPAFLKQLKDAGQSLPEIAQEGTTNIRKFKIEELELGPIESQEEILQIEEGINLLIGNDFLDAYVLTIDWENHELFLAPNER